MAVKQQLVLIQSVYENGIRQAEYVYTSDNDGKPLATGISCIGNNFVSNINQFMEELLEKEEINDDLHFSCYEIKCVWVKK